MMVTMMQVLTLREIKVIMTTYLILILITVMLKLCCVVYCGVACRDVVMVLLSYVVLCCGMLCCAMVCHGVLCFTMLCNVLLC